MNLRLLGDRVLVKVERPEGKTSGGILIPNSANKKPTSATVLEIGPGVQLRNGEYRKAPCKVGDKALITGVKEPLDVLEKDCYIIDFQDILAIERR